MGYRIRIDEPGDHPRVVDVTAPVEVGRQVDGIRLFDPTVSRRHLRLEVQAAGLLVTDLDSSYGSYVRGYRLGGPVLVQPGEVVQVGNTRLTVLGPLPSIGDPAAGVVDPTVGVTVTPPPPPQVGITPPPPGITPPPPGITPAPPGVPAPAPRPPVAPAAPVVPVASVSAPPLADRPAAQALALNALTLLALALPVELVVTIGDALTDLRADDLTGRLVLLSASLLVSLAGLLGVTTLRAMYEGARDEDADGVVPRPSADRRLVALGVLPAWCVAMSIVAVVHDPPVGALSAVAMASVVAIWVWASRRAAAPAPAVPVDAAALPRPPVRQVAVAALALLAVLVVVVTGLALGRAFDRAVPMGTAVVELFVIAQAPLPLLGLLRP